MIKLRNYQTDIIASLKKQLKNFKKIVVVAPTRSGKTIIFSDIASKVESAGKRALILTHRQEIFDQTVLKLSNFNVSSGQIKSDKIITKNLIQTGMVLTVHSRLKKQERIKQKMGFKKFNIIEKPDIILIDECHHAVSKTWKEVLQYFDDVPRVGFTATPERLDGSGLIELFDNLVIGKSTQWMVDNHWLSKPIHLCPPSPLEKENLKTIAGDYDKKTMSDIMKKHVVCADVVKTYREFFNGAPVIVFCCTIEHAETMTEAYKADGWEAIAIHGKLKKSARNDAMNGFRDGKYKVLLSVDLIGEGIDVPACYGVQLLRKTQSLALYLQMAARGLTPIYADGYSLENNQERKQALMKGKPESLIIDHAGNYWIHGSILKPRDWSIDHKKRNSRKKTLIPKIECPQCHFTWEAGIKKCPHCGFNFNVARQEKKKFEMVELQDTLVNVYDIEQASAESLSKVILRIKEYKNKKNAMLAILHNSIRDGENNINNKIAAMCKGLGYDNNFRFRVWRHLREQYGERLEMLR